MATKKKATTHRKAQPSQLELDITFERHHATPEEFEGWKIEGAIYAAMLSRRECPTAFRDAFYALFNDILLDKTDLAHPSFIQYFFPLVVLSMQGDAPIEAITIVDALRTLRETLAPELTTEILGKLKGEGL